MKLVFIIGLLITQNAFATDFFGYNEVTSTYQNNEIQPVLYYCQTNGVMMPAGTCPITRRQTTCINQWNGWQWISICQ